MLKRRGDTLGMVICLFKYFNSYKFNRIGNLYINFCIKNNIIHIEIIYFLYKILFTQIFRLTIT